MDVGNNDMGARDVTPDMGDDGRYVVTNIRNGYVRIYRKLCLRVNS